MGGLKFIDLFAGVGGFRLGLEKHGHRCVFSSEVDKYARAVYEYKWERPEGDIREISATDIPDHDILCGGFPCQSFSIAGKRKGFQDIRGTLFAEIVRIAKEKRPRLLFLENVKGLLSADFGRCFGTILTALAELGYHIEWEVLNSKNFGVPQNRERVFIVGHLGGTSWREVFPIGGENKKDYRHVGQEVSTCLDANYFKGVSPKGFQSSKRQLIGTLRTHKNGYGFREIKSGLSPTIPARAREDGSGQPCVAIPLKFLDRNQKNYQGEYSFTVDSMNTGGVLKDMRIRRLTPLECERLQGFPDNWTRAGIIDGEEVEISDTQRYKMMGNAVTVNVIEAIAERFDG